MQGHFIRQPALTEKHKMDSLVEFKTTYNTEVCELHIFETHQTSENIPLYFDELTLTSMIRGKKQVKLGSDSSKFTYLPGSSVIVSPQEEMLIDFPEADSHPSQCLALTLNNEYLTRVLQDYNQFQPKINDDSSWSIATDIFFVSNSAGLAGATNNILRIMTEDNPYKGRLAELAINELILRLIHSQGQVLLRQGKLHGRFGDLVQYIKGHLHEKLHMDQLSKIAHVSKSNFYKLFKQELGLTPNEFILQQRISLAKKLLMKNKTINEVAYETGFSDANYFIKIFKKSEGVTPKVFQVKMYS